jgi:hypothetical protein
MSNVLRVAVSNVRIPRSHRMTSLLLVAAGQDVLGRQQPLFDRRGDAALEHHWLAHVTELAQ